MEVSYDRDAWSGGFFCHNSMPNERFYYLVAIGATHSQITNDLGHLLKCRTRRLCLRIGRQHDAPTLCSHRSLLDEKDEQCGFIQLNTTPTYYYNWSRDPLIGTSCELIAISEGSTPAHRYSTSVWGKFGTMAKTGDAEFYNVLWIEWVDGRAYRKALGQVAKSAWDSHPDDWIDVVLG